MKPELKPRPVQRQHFNLALTISEAERARLRLGRVSREMDEKWEIVFEDGWLFFHRSWTGYCIFGLHIDGGADGALVDAWASRDADQYGSDDVAFDKAMLEKLIAGELR